MMLAHTSPDREFDLSSIRCAVSAGEALPPALFHRFRERFGIEILDGIGSTEVLHIFISNQPGRARPGSSGVPVPGYEARLVDEDGRPVRQGELGDLIVRGDSTCAFYWNQHEQTKDTIAGHWIRTGDKYQQDEDGFFWFAGRSDDMLKVGGIWVSPAEVEHLLLEHPAVQACAVTGREDHDGLVKPVAHVVLRTGITAGNELGGELQQFARQRLAEYKRPRWIEFVDALPVTATGKIQRFKLRARGRLVFQACLPVQHNGNRRGVLVLCADVHEKALAIAGDHILVPAVDERGPDAGVEQALRRARLEDGVGARDSGRLQRAIGCQVEQFPAVPAPLRLRPAVGGHLPFAFAARKSPHVDLVPARFIRRVGQPSHVRRQPGLPFVRGRCQERDALAGRVDRDRPQVRLAAAVPFAQQETTVRRPVGHDDGPRGVQVQQQRVSA